MLSKELDRKSVIKTAGLIFLPLFILLCGVAVFIYYLDLTTETKIFQDREKHIVDLQRNIITRDFSDIFSHLIFLSELNEYSALFEKDIYTTRNALAKEFLSAIQQIGIYDQIRYLDETGMETVRVNYNNDLPFIVPETQLQNKSKRYYFKESFQLEYGEIFVSQLDLNIERGVIEKPFKPMIRFGTPVFDHRGKKKGVVLLNYFGKILIDELKMASENAPGSVMLIDPKGYWLHGPNPEDEWGFMFKDRKERVFQKKYPEAWKKITATGSGQIRLSNGIFTFDTVFPLSAGWKSRSTKQPAGKAYHWKIVSYLPSETVRTRPLDRFQSYLLIYMFVIVLLAMGSVALSMGRVRQRQDKAALLESEHRFRTIADFTYAWEYWITPEKTIDYVSPSCRRISGYSTDEIAKNPGLLNEMIHPDDQAIYENHMAQDFDSTEAVSLEFRITTQSVEERWIAHTCQPVYGPDGAFRGRRVSNRDVTEQKQFVIALREAEERFRSIVEGLKREHLFYIHNADGVFTYLSPSVQEVLGYSADEFMNRGESILTDNPINEAVKQNTEHTLKGRQQSSFEMEVFHKDGRTRLLEVTNVPIFDEQNTVIGVGGVAHDITERKQMETSLKERVNELASARRAMLNMMEDLQAAQEKANEANKAKGDFLANMSHEIRTPMNAVIGMAHLALKTDLTAKQQDYITKIQSSANSLLGIINDILDFSKIEAGKLDMESVDFNLEDVLDNLAGLISVKAREKEDLEVLFATAKDVPRYLVGDPLRLGQVLINLANNALKFTDSGEIVVSTELIEKNKDQVALKFSVNDTGIGLTQEQVNTLFEAFSQADSSITRQYGGTGLGLSISKRLVEMMGGEIWVKSEHGRGSTFSFTGNFGLGKEKAKRRFKPSPDLRGLKALVVDDNATSREILKDMLESFSFEVIPAATGEEGLAELEKSTRETPFELVIMDWKLPGIDGIEASKRIKKQTNLPKTPPIILVTAYGRDDVIQQAEQAGLEGFLLKPISPSVLFDTIMQTMGRDIPSASRVKQDKDRETEILEHIRGARVLLVEDNDINRQVANEILKDVGVHVSMVNNGKEAVEAVKENDYDAVLMDIQMPVMDGYTATREIRKWEHELKAQSSKLKTNDTAELSAFSLEPSARAKRMPIIAMTAHAMAQDHEKSLNAGMNDHITKPIDPNQLFAALGKWIQPFPERGESAERPSISETTPDIVIDPAAEDIFPASLPGFDLATGVNRLRGNRSIYKKLLLDFAAGYTGTAEEIRKTLDLDEMDQAHHLVHSLKGAAGNIAATDLLAAASELETLVRKQGKDGDVSPDLLKAKFQEMENALQQAINSVQSLGPIPDKKGNAFSQESLSQIPSDLAKDAAARIRNAAEMGDVGELTKIGNELKSQSDAFAPVSEMIVSHAEEFNFEEILQLARELDNIVGDKPSND